MAEDQKLMRPFFAEFSFLLREIGYFHIQATKPNTAGILKQFQFFPIQKQSRILVTA